MTDNNDFVNVASFASRSEVEFVLFTSLLDSEGIEYHILNHKDFSSVGGWSVDSIQIAVRQIDFENAKCILYNHTQSNTRNAPCSNSVYKPFCPKCDSDDVIEIQQKTNFSLSKYKCNHCNNIFRSKW